MVITKKHLFGFLFFIIICVIISKIGPDIQTPQSPQKIIKNQKKEPVIPKKTKDKTSYSSQKTTGIEPEALKMRLDMAVNEIKENYGVRDAYVSIEKSIATLALIIDYSISKERAKTLGENFVRLVKGLSDDISPGKEIGSGKYNYLIGVYYPNKEEVVMGTKVSAMKKIRW